MKPNKIAIIDVDDTLADMRTLLSSALIAHSGQDIHWKEWAGTGLEELYDIPHADFMDVLKSYKVIEQMMPHDDSLSFTKTLIDSGYNVTLLTARNWHPNSRSVTEQWLENHGLVYNDLMICNIEDDKAEIVRNAFGRVELTVDDSKKHCTSYVKSEIVSNVFVYDMPWNKCTFLDKNAIRINKLSQALKHIRN
jgi:5'(3')-deoxyribonucleotidase